MDAFESSVIEKLSETVKNYAVLAEEFSSMRRDVERIGNGVDRINERHETIRMSCAEHCAKTDIAYSKAEAAEKRIESHENGHLTWYGIILGAAAILPVVVKKAALFLDKLWGGSLQ